MSTSAAEGGLLRLGTLGNLATPRRLATTDLELTGAHGAGRPHMSGAGRAGGGGRIR
jgi:hypothetical protein